MAYFLSHPIDERRLHSLKKIVLIMGDHMKIICSVDEKRDIPVGSNPILAK